MTPSPPIPEAPPQPASAPSPASGGASRAGLAIAAGFGLGSVPRAPGTAGSLISVALFAPLLYGLGGTVQQFVYLFVLAWLIPLALWSIEQGLAQWTGHDPQLIVIDEVVGQWVAYAGLVLAPRLGLSVPASSGWKYLLAGFILFRVFDATKPFPLRRSERLPGAAGVLVDDVLAGAYAALGLLLLAWTEWLK